MKARHVVVTGAGGFVGGYLARWLARRGFTVSAIARQAFENEKFTRLSWLQKDLRDPHALPERFDSLVHCAAAIPARCSDPGELYNANLEMAHNAFDSAKAAGAESIVFLSSMSVYGKISEAIVTETTPTNSPDPYGRAKLDAEHYLERCVTGGLRSGLAIRLPGTVGSGSHDNFLSSALNKVLSDQAVQASNPAAPFNNIVYVGHLAQFMADWIAAPRPGYVSTNLAASHPISIAQVFSLLFSEARKPERITFVNGAKSPFTISLDRACALGYRPATVETSVKAFVRDCLSQNGLTRECSKSRG